MVSMSTRDLVSCDMYLNINDGAMRCCIGTIIVGREIFWPVTSFRIDVLLSRFA